jgi:hypothetical protein
MGNELLEFLGNLFQSIAGKIKSEVIARIIVPGLRVY